jgi:site-specific DNA recombinase
LLSNPIYVGKIKHRDKLYIGEHEAIIEPGIFAQVQALLKDQTVWRRSTMNTVSTHLLTGLVFDEEGQKLRATHANKRGKRYGYYVSKKFVEERGDSIDSGWRLPVMQLDDLVVQALHDILANQAMFSTWFGDSVEAARLRQAIRTAYQIRAEWHAMSVEQRQTMIRRFVLRVDLRAGAFVLKVDREALISVLARADRQPGAADTIERIVSIEHRMSLRRRGVETKMQLDDYNGRASTPDGNLIKLVHRAHRYLTHLTNGSAQRLSDIAAAHQADPADVSRLLPLAFLSPKIVDAILSGHQPLELTAQRLSRLPDLPLDWAEQETLLGM